MSKWQEKLLSNKIKEISKIIEHRKLITSIYNQKLQEKGIGTVQVPKYWSLIFLRYPIKVGNKWKILEKAKKVTNRTG